MFFLDTLYVLFRHRTFTQEVEKWKNVDLCIRPYPPFCIDLLPKISWEMCQVNQVSSSESHTTEAEMVILSIKKASGSNRRIASGVQSKRPMYTNTPKTLVGPPI